MAGLGIRVIVVVGLVGAAIVHTILRRLLAIVHTVRVGDPFILENAQRLEDITVANLSILKTGKAKAIRFSTLEAICVALDCQPGELLEFRREDLADNAVAVDASERAHA